MVGYNAGMGITSGSYNVIVGTGTSNFGATQNNGVYIGCGARATGSFNNSGAIGANAEVATEDTLVLGNTTQSVVIGSNTAIASALLFVDSTTKGFLPPRMSTTQKNAIASPVAGLMVYDFILNKLSYYNGSSWINL